MTNKELFALNQAVVRTVAAILNSAIDPKSALALGTVVAVNFDTDIAVATIHTDVRSLNQFEQTRIQNIVGLTNGLTFNVEIEGDHLDIVISPISED